MTTVSAVAMEPGRLPSSMRWWKRLCQMGVTWVALVVPPLSFVLVVVAFWAYLSGQGVLPKYVLPSPGAIAGEFNGNHAVLIKHAVYTVAEALSGFFIGNAIAILAALGFSYSAVLRDSIYPFALVSRAIPMVAFTPLIVIMLGRGLPPVITVVAISVYFPTLLNMVGGLRSADVDYHELLHTMSASPLQRLKLVELPASMPYLFAALKISASSAFISALVAEWIGANRGLGYLVVISGQYFKLPLLWAAIFSAAGLTLVLLAIVFLVERLLHRWTAAPAEL